MTLASRWQRGLLVLAATLALASGLIVLRAFLAAPRPALPRPDAALSRPHEPAQTGPAAGSAPAGVPVEARSEVRTVPATPVPVRRVDPAPGGAEPVPTPASVAAGPSAGSTQAVQAQPLPTVSAASPATRGRSIASIAPPDSDRIDRP